jgi:hypothetical protein
LVFSNTYRNGGGTDYACNKIAFFGGLNTPTTSSTYGFGVSLGQLDYFCSEAAAHVFYTGTTGGTGYGTERMRIASNGNIGIGTTNPITSFDIYNPVYAGAILCLDAGGEGDTSGTQNPRGIGKPLIKLGKKAWSTVGGGSGDYYGIGFGYSPLLSDFNCADDSCLKFL